MASLSDSDFSCGSPSVSVDTSGFEPGGKVVVEVTCTVALSDLSTLSVPGSQTITSSAAEPIDPYRVVE